MAARIYRPSPNAMQSGRANTKEWMLEFDGSAARSVDPLMGWTSSSDTNSQVRMYFDTREEAIEFAQRHGIEFQVREARIPKPIIKSYADNFSYTRKKPWTH
ncbi:MAG: ETC complex I subunit [Alphaproteobacteria bacterium]|nr:ETC complex I subunit [Alphaproteobacteria bacterium]